MLLLQVNQKSILDHLAAAMPDIQNQAALLDKAGEFPYAIFKQLKTFGLLTATLPESLGGHGFGYGPQGAAALLQLFLLLGESSLPVARLYEAHVNALQLICRYGTPALAAQCAEDAKRNEIFALWVTDPHDGGVNLRPEADGFVLEGGKAFCSGAGVATRALITAATEAGIRMLVVELNSHTRILPSAIKLNGMRAAITGSVDFSGMRVSRYALLGEAGDYLREPVFSAGAWRGAAAALGGLTALVKIHRREITKRQRADDPHQLARFGQLVMAHETAQLWMQKAVFRGCLEDGENDEIVAYINLARLAVEKACLDGLQFVQRGLGLSAFIDGHPAESICRDLAVYLRQPAPDETLTKAAQFYFSAGLPGGEK